MFLKKNPMLYFLRLSFVLLQTNLFLLGVTLSLGWVTTIVRIFSNEFLHAATKKGHGAFLILNERLNLDI
jgi:ABC-type microcin C transport system permease subunit YejE